MVWGALWTTQKCWRCSFGNLADPYSGRCLFVHKLRGNGISAAQKRACAHHDDIAFLQTFLDFYAVAGEKTDLHSAFAYFVIDDREHSRAVIQIKHSG